MTTKPLRWSNWTAGVGTAAIVLGAWVYLERPGWEAPAYWLMLSGGGLVVGGSCYLARAKGYPAALGLLSLFCLAGLTVLFLLPDRNPRGETN